MALHGHAACILIRIHISDGTGEFDIALGNDARLAVSVHRADESNRHALVGLDAVRAGEFLPFRIGPANVRIFMATEEALRPMPFFINLRRIFRHFVIIKDIQHIIRGRLIIDADIRPICLPLFGRRPRRPAFRLLLVFHLLFQFGLGRRQTPPFLIPGRFIGRRRTDLLSFRPIVAKARRRMVVRRLAVLTLGEIGVISVPAVLRAVPGQIPGIRIIGLHHAIRLVVQIAVTIARDFRDGLRLRVAETHHAFDVIGDKISRREIVGQIVRNLNIGNAVQADDFSAARRGETSIDENISTLAFDIRRQKRLRRRVVVHRHDVFIIAFLFVVRLAARDDTIIRIPEDAVIRHVSAGIAALDFRQTILDGLRPRRADMILIVQLRIRGNRHVEIVITALHRPVQIDIGRIDENISARDTPAGRRNHLRSRYLRFCLAFYFFVIGRVLILVLLFHVAADIFNPVDIALRDTALRSNELDRLAVNRRFLAGLFIFPGHDDIIGLAPNFDRAILRVHFTPDIDIRHHRDRLFFSVHEIMHLIGRHCRRFLRVSVNGDCPRLALRHMERPDRPTRILIGFCDIRRRVHGKRIVIHFAARLGHDDRMDICRKGRIILDINRRCPFGRERAATGNIARLRIDIPAGRHHVGQIDVIHIEFTGHFIIFRRFVIRCQTGRDEHLHQRRIFGFIPQARTAAFRIFTDELHQFRDTAFDIADIIVRTDREIGSGNPRFIRFVSVFVINLYEIAHLPISRIRFFGRRQFFVIRIAQKGDIISRHALAFLLIIRTHVLVLLFRQYDETLVRIAADRDFLIMGNTGRDISRHRHMIVRLVIAARRISVLIDIEFSVRLGDILRIALAAVSRIESDEPADVFFPRIGVQIHILHRFDVPIDVDDIVLREIVDQRRFPGDRNDGPIEHFRIRLQIERRKFIRIEFTGIQAHIAAAVNIAVDLHLVVSRDVVGRLSEDRTGQARAVFRFRTIGDGFFIGHAENNIAVFSECLQRRARFRRDQIVGLDIEFIAHERTASDDAECVHESIGRDIVRRLGPIFLLAFGCHMAQIRRRRAVDGIGETGRRHAEGAVPVSFDDVILSVDRAECVIVFRADAHFATRLDDRIGDRRFRFLIGRIRRARPTGTGHGRTQRIRHHLRIGMIDRRCGKITGNIVIPAHDKFRIGLHGIDRFGRDRADIHDTAAVAVRFGDARHAASRRQRHRFRVHGFGGKFHRHMAVAFGIRFIRTGRRRAADRLSVDIRRIGRIVISAHRQSAAFSGCDVARHDLRLAVLIDGLRLRVDPLMGRKGNISHADADLAVQIRIGAIDDDIDQTHIDSPRIGIRFHFAQRKDIHIVGDNLRPVSDADFTRAVRFRTGNDAAARDETGPHRADFGRRFRRIRRKYMKIGRFQRIVLPDGNLIDAGLVIARSDDGRRFRRIAGHGRRGIHIRFRRALRCIGRRDANFLVFRLFRLDIFCRGDKFPGGIELRFRRSRRDRRIIHRRKLAAVIDGNRIVQFVFDRGKKHTDADTGEARAFDSVRHLQRFQSGNIQLGRLIGIRCRIGDAMRFRFERGRGNIHRILPAPDETGHRDIDGTGSRRRLMDLLRDAPVVIRRHREFLSRDGAALDGDLIVRLDIRDADGHIDADGAHGTLRQIHLAIRRRFPGNIHVFLRRQRRTRQGRRDAGRSRVRLLAVPSGIICLLRLMRCRRRARFLRVPGRSEFGRRFVGRGEPVQCFLTNFARAVRAAVVCIRIGKRRPDMVDIHIRADPGKARCRRHTQRLDSTGFLRFHIDILRREAAAGHGHRRCTPNVIEGHADTDARDTGTRRRIRAFEFEIVPGFDGSIRTRRNI